MKCNKCNADVMVLFKTDHIEVCIECYEPPRDKIVDNVVKKYQERAKYGYAKYKTNLERNDLNTFEWLNHLQDELMDATLYVEKLKEQYEPTWDDIHFKLSEQGYYDTNNSQD